MCASLRAGGLILLVSLLLLTLALWYWTYNINVPAICLPSAVSFTVVRAAEEIIYFAFEKRSLTGGVNHSSSKTTEMRVRS